MCVHRALLEHMAPYSPLGTSAGSVVLLQRMCDILLYVASLRSHMLSCVFLCASTRSPLCLSTWLQLVRQFEKGLLIVDDVQVMNARPNLHTVGADYVIA